MLLFTPSAPQVPGLSHQEQNLLDQVWAEWAARRPRNVLRKGYIDSKQHTRHLGISIPPNLQDLDIAIGLPETAIEGMASRVNWDGIVAPSGDDDPFELEETLDENRFDIEFPQAVRSALGQSVAFISQSLGDVASGEPRVKIMNHSALWSAGIWDKVRRGLRGFISISSVDDLGRPTALTFMTPDADIELYQVGDRWVGQKWAHPTRRLMVEPLPYAPTLDRPLGVSRVNRRVMSYTDRAVRTILRLEIHSEMFSLPKLLLMGADEATFMNPKTGQPIPFWTWYTTRLNVIPGKETGGEKMELPELKEIAQQSPQPHVENLREIYAEFSGETKVPLNSLGVVQDNPPSAEGLYAMKEDLVIATGNFIRVATATLNRAQQNVLMLRDGLTELTPEMRRISQRFRNPAAPSVVSQSDAIVKQISAIPDLALTDVVLEELGYTEEQIIRIRSDIKREAGGSLARQAIEAARARRVQVSDSAVPAVSA